MVLIFHFVKKLGHRMSPWLLSNAYGNAGTHLVRCISVCGAFPFRPRWSRVLVHRAAFAHGRGQYLRGRAAGHETRRDHQSAMQEANCKRTHAQTHRKMMLQSATRTCGTALARSLEEVPNRGTAQRTAARACEDRGGKQAAVGAQASE